LSRNRLYILVFFACVVGYAWIIMLQCIKLSHAHEPDVCLFKYLTNIPCPSCGSSRSVLAILHGDIHEAYYLNPIGFLISLILLIAPFWIAGDVFLKRSSFLQFYRHIEILLKRKWISIPAVILVLINWIWNINKNL
jgi:hypothetical protein